MLITAQVEQDMSFEAIQKTAIIETRQILRKTLQLKETVLRQSKGSHTTSLIGCIKTSYSGGNNNNINNNNNNNNKKIEVMLKVNTQIDSVIEAKRQNSITVGIQICKLEVQKR